MDGNGNLNLPLRLTTYAYLIFTLMGVVTYNVLPLGLNAFGAQTGVYIFLYAGLNTFFGEMAKGLGIALMVAAALILMLTLALCAYALSKRMYTVLLTVVMTDVVLSYLFFLWCGSSPEGVGLLNLLYGGWLALTLLIQKKQAE